MAIGGRRIRRTMLAAAIAAAALVPLGPHPALGAPSVPCRRAIGERLRRGHMDIVQMRTFTVEIEPLAKAYKIGKPAKVAVTVTRPAHTDPAQVGPEFDPPASAPAADVNVGVGIHVGEVFVPGFAQTDEKGEATVSIRLPSYMKPGAANLDGYAWKVQADSPCLTIEEDGYTHMDKAFVVTR